MNGPIEMKPGEQYYFAGTDTCFDGQVYHYCGKCNLTRSTCTASPFVTGSTMGAPEGAVCCMCKGPARIWTMTEIMADRLGANGPKSSA